MNKHDLVRLLAAKEALAPAAAADRLDSVVDQILRRLRQGSTVCLPGLGILTPDANAQVKLCPICPKSGRKD